MDKSSVRNRIKAEYSDLRERLRLLKEVVSEGDVQMSSVVHVLPALSKEDIGVDEQHVVVEHVYGHSAFDSYMDHITDFGLGSEHPGQMAKRLPGTVVLYTDKEQEIRDRIIEINNLKDRFDKFVIKKAGSNSDERFETVSLALGPVIRKAITRHLHMAPPNTFSVSHTWTKRKYFSKVGDKWSWIKRLEKALVSKGDTPLEEGWKQAIDIEIDVMRKQRDDSLFRIKRPLRVTQMSNVIYDKSASDPRDYEKDNHIAHTPVLVFNQEPKISVLRDYDGMSKVEGDGVAVLPRLHLYSVN